MKVIPREGVDDSDHTMISLYPDDDPTPPVQVASVIHLALITGGEGYGGGRFKAEPLMADLYRTFPGVKELVWDPFTTFALVPWTPGRSNCPSSWNLKSLVIRDENIEAEEWSHALRSLLFSTTGLERLDLSYYSPDLCDMSAAEEPIHECVNLLIERYAETLDTLHCCLTN